MDEKHEVPVPAIDQIANGDHLSMYKAVIPYLPKHFQKSCIMLIKMMELNNLMTFYNSPMSACSFPSHSSDPEDILTELRQYGNEEQNQKIDQITSLLSALKLYQTYYE